MPVGLPENRSIEMNRFFMWTLLASRRNYKRVQRRPSVHASRNNANNNFRIQLSLGKYAKLAPPIVHSYPYPNHALLEADFALRSRAPWTKNTDVSANRISPILRLGTMPHPEPDEDEHLGEDCVRRCD